jgi:hypothetical protein
VTPHSLLPGDLPLSIGPVVSLWSGGPLCRVVWADRTWVHLLYTDQTDIACPLIVLRSALEKRMA